MAAIRIGVSGWSYDSWRNGRFYPDDLPRRAELEYVTRRFPAVEINGSFYSLVKPDSWIRYADAAPDDFRFAVKGSRFITHMKSLKDARTPLANFLASGVLRLEEKLGPILWQLPERAADAGRLKSFIDLLPDDTERASRLARRHDHRLTGRASFVSHSNRPVRHGLELRNERLFTDDIVRHCRARDIALVVSDSGGKWAYTEEQTAAWTYVRLHGAPRVYASRYSDQRLDHWADRILDWHRGTVPDDADRITDLDRPAGGADRDVWVFFDNDQKGNAPLDARRLVDRLGSEPAG